MSVLSIIYWNSVLFQFSQICCIFWKSFPDSLFFCFSLIRFCETFSLCPFKNCLKNIFLYFVEIIFFCFSFKWSGWFVKDRFLTDAREQRHITANRTQQPLQCSSSQSGLIGILASFIFTSCCVQMSKSHKRKLSKTISINTCTISFWISFDHKIALVIKSKAFISCFVEIN